MKTKVWISTCLAVGAMFLSSAPAQAQIPVGDGRYQVAPAGLLGPSELDQLLQPLAIYSDAVLAAILPAATRPDQIAAAGQYANGGAQAWGPQVQSWDPAVQTLLNYPEALSMMSQNLDWTAAVGQAFLNQSGDVSLSIQRLRGQASAVILPESPPVNFQFFYTPNYDPGVIFLESNRYHRPRPFRFNQGEFNRRADNNFRRPDFNRPSSNSFHRPDSNRPSSNSFHRPDSNRPSSNNFHRPDSNRPSSNNFLRPDSNRPSSNNYRPDSNRPSNNNFQRPDSNRPSNNNFQRHESNRPANVQPSHATFTRPAGPASPQQSNPRPSSGPQNSGGPGREGRRHQR